MVTDSRASTNAVRRRRHCLKCGKRYNTFERAVEERLPDGVRQAVERIRDSVSDVSVQIEALLGPPKDSL